MAPGSRCMSCKTCGCRMSWMYRWAVMVPRINTRGDPVLKAIRYRTITPAVGAVCHRIEAFTTGSPHTNTIVITAEIESRFVAKDDLVPFRCSPVSSCAAPLQTEASMGGRQGQHTYRTPLS
ncbi:hypothetical protein TNCV_4546771 [Trichonephila clavipes]|nr:hypothetical protein TNCV_4546771 [Trichonephila clavipes]